MKRIFRSIESSQKNSICRSEWVRRKRWLQQAAAHQRAQLDADGIVYPDYLILGGRKDGESMNDYWKRMLRDLKPGVTELFIHASVAGDEIAHITNSWKDRAEEYRLFTKDAEVRQILESQNVKRIGFRALRDLQRKSRGANKAEGTK